MTKYTTDDVTFFEGIPSGEPLWNGFETPMFTQSEALRIMEHVNGQGVHWMGYDAIDDVFFWDPSYEREYREVFERVRIDGQTFYLIGTSSWTWIS